MGFGMVESACFHYTPAQGAVSMMCWLTLALSLCSQRECGYWGAKNSLKADRFLTLPMAKARGFLVLSSEQGVLP